MNETVNWVLVLSAIGVIIALFVLLALGFAEQSHLERKREKRRSK